ncbi:hypothetical protein LTR86_003685 [Recurvomyces mirabilis]|nr:hypothetical protein LTR86_003685 [Recurvomyces mirabilis]
MAIPRDLSSSQATFPSSEDSENYDANHSNQDTTSPSGSPPSSSSSPMILYQPPTIWSILRGAAINLLLPFVNGLMLGFGELFAHEAAYRLGWANTKIFPSHRSSNGTRAMGPGVVIRDDPIERKRRDGEEMDAYTALE